MPERLLRVGWYSSLTAADEQLRRLQEAGLDAYVAGEPQSLVENIELLVPESQLESARALLGIEPEAPLPPEIEAEPSPVGWPGTRRCPECHSTDVRKLPPYAAWVLLGSVALLAATAALGKAWIGGAGMLIGWVAVMLLSRHAGHYRCRNCRREWQP